MKILVTGGAGFIGSYLLRHLVETGRAPIFNFGRRDPEIAGVTHIDCDLSDEVTLSRLLADVSPDRVYHLAGASRVSATIGLPDYFRGNFLTTVYLAKAMEKLRRPTRLFFASTVHVYGNHAGETDESTDARPRTAHGFSKYLAEEALRGLVSRGAPVRIVVGRLYSCIGPGQPEGFVAADLCRRLADLSDTDEPLRTGPLAPFRRFVDVRDVVKLLPSLLEADQPNPYEVYNLASPHELSIRDLVEKLMQISGKHPPLETDDEIGDNPFTGLKLSTVKLEKKIALPMFRPIEQTLREMYQSAGGTIA